jgi:hypothetical protein
LANSSYPCPVCVGTMMPGVTYSFPRKDAELSKGTGKIWGVYTGAATAYPPPQGLVDCYRCKGTGLVAERRMSMDRRIFVNGRRGGDGPV